VTGELVTFVHSLGKKNRALLLVCTYKHYLKFFASITDFFFSFSDDITDEFSSYILLLLNGLFSLLLCPV
jgi:hypothetical protein